MISTDTHFYGLCLKPFSNGTTRWQVHYVDGDGKLQKLWPVDCHDHNKSKAQGWTYSPRGSKWPAYHIRINEVGTSHEYLLREAIAYILHKGFNQPLVDANDIKMEVLN